MIRLVHQFDSPRTRAQAAAPKSSGGCCCCCCCCIATVIGASVLTARATGKGFRPRPQGSFELESAAPTESVFRPSAGDVPVPNMRTMPSAWWKLFGFFLLPLVISGMIAIGVATQSGGGAIVGGVMLETLGLLLLRHKAGLRGYWFPILLVGIPVMTVVEAFVWIMCIFK